MADAVAANAAPAAATPAASPSAQAPVGEAALTKLPEKLQNLTRPVVVTGTVIGETPEGLTRVRTAVGEVQMQAPAPLPTDKPVTLQIPAGSPPPKAMVLAQPPATPQAPTTQTQAPIANQAGGAAQALLQTVATAAAAQPGQMPAVGSLISAVVLAANPRPTLTAPPLAPPLAAPGATPGATTQPPAAAGKGDSAAAGNAAPDGQAASTPTAGAGVAGRGAAHGQPVELGGDAAHRGTMLDPPPGKLGPGKQGEATPQQQQPQPGQQPPAPRQPASPQTTSPAGQPAPPSPAPPTPAPPLPASPTAQTETPQAPPPTPPPPGGGQTMPRGPSVGLAAREFPSPPPAQQSPTLLNPAAPNPPPQSTIPQSSTPQNTPSLTQSTPPPAQQAQPGAPAPISTQAAPPIPPTLQTGQTLAFKVAAAVPPPAPGQPVPPPGPTINPEGAALLEGEVAGLTPQGKPILALKDGMLALNTDLRPPPGSRLTLQLLDPAALALEKAAPAAAALPDYLQGRDWPALKMALTALRDLDPAMVQQFLAAAMPQPNRKLGAALTFLISAMRGGDARGWLGGDAARSLQRAGKESLLQAMEQEFRNVERQTTEKLPDDWRGVALPFFDQTGINPLHLYFHPLPEPEKDDEQAGKGKATRFVLDVDLSKLGPLQLDGMVKPPQFDMILRSRTPLPPELRDELRMIFADCLAAVGYAGGLTFKADVRGWANLARAGSAAPGVSA